MRPIIFRQFAIFLLKDFYEREPERGVATG